MADITKRHTIFLPLLALFLLHACKSNPTSSVAANRPITVNPGIQQLDAPIPNAGPVFTGASVVFRERCSICHGGGGVNPGHPDLTKIASFDEFAHAVRTGVQHGSAITSMIAFRSDYYLDSEMKSDFDTLSALPPSTVQTE